MTTTLHEASRQWASRPDDERFTSLHDMQATMAARRASSSELVLNTRELRAVPMDGFNRLAIETTNAAAPGELAPTHAAFSQLCAYAGSPPGFLRTLPAPIAADCLNYCLAYKTAPRDIGALTTATPGATMLRAATGPRYRRIWNDEVLAGLTANFGDGINGRFRVPGEFGQRVEVTKANTTLFAGDRDMFVFLADEENRIEVPGRRDGQTGSMARGFFVWNSETGDNTLGVKAFLFDYVCCNRIVWGASAIETVKIRHTSGAPERFVEELRPALESYLNSSASSITDAIAEARKQRYEPEALDVFLAHRYGKKAGESIKLAHLSDEGRPIESRWDIVTGVTAYARSLPYQDARVALETDAGELLETA